MIHATPFGYPPRTPAELHQDQAEACMAAEDAWANKARFEEAPVRSEHKDVVQAIIGQCIEAKAEFQRTLHEQTLNEGGYNLMQVAMAQAKYIGFANGTFEQILAECRRLT